ncbi:hypothetical protein V5799_022334 [Amblyomma americanum]|uniref:Transcriptional adapter 3 n=1 Tax=Amblyomma americanum TaxID=6943 RepID=A0AAQ4FN43_AMBAM
MKGKGKGSEECPLQFPDVSPVDHAQDCPRYTAIAQGDATLSLEDLEPLQLELETLLVSVCERRRRLAHETQLLLSWQEKKIPVGGSTPSAPGKRSRASPDGKPSKKFRDGGKVFTGGRPPRKQVASSSSTLATGSTTEEGPSVSRNDAPNRFWASLEPYCGQVTADDVRALEELMRAREEEASEYQRVPPLGRHYAQRWAQEDLQEEQTQGARATGGGAQGARSPQQTRGSLNNCDTPSSGGNSKGGSGGGEPLGSLTQRLVSCLLEENLLCPPLEDNQLGPPLGPSPGLAQQLERRVRRELREHGLLTETDPPDDQVLAELRRCQAELRSVSSRNGSQLTALLRRARESLAQQELNRRLRVADHELLDAWRRLAQVRQRKKTPSKKDRDLAAKALRDRQSLLKQRPSSAQR